MARCSRQRISRGSSMADQSLVMPALAAHGTSTLPAVEVESLQCRAQGRRGLRRRPRLQGRVPRHSSKAGASRCASSATTRSATSRAACSPRSASMPCSTNGDPEAAGIVHGAIESFAQELGAGDAPLPQAQGVEGRRTPDHRRRLQRQPGRRARDRPRLGDPEGRQDQDRHRDHPQRSRRGGPARVGRISRRPGYSRPTTPSSPSISAAPTSAPASSSSI